MSKLSQVIQRISNWRTFFILLVAVCILIIIPDFFKTPIGPLKFEEYSHGMKMLDMTINYTPEDAYNLIKNYGRQARMYYLYVMEPFDALIPAIMGLFLCITSTIALRNIIKEKFFIFIYLFPIFAWLLDYMENIGIIIMLINFPSRLLLAARITNFITMVKMIFSTINIIIVCSSILVNVFYKLLKKSNKERTTIDEGVSQ